MAEFEKMDLESADLVAERIEQLKQLLPEIATEGGIDFDRLRLVLGDEVDEGTERYAFTWPGKTDAIRQSQTPSTATLRPCPEESVNWDETENLYIEGDNLEVLKLLQHSYHGRVKLIYIDPPYNTGHDFVYRDKFGDTIANYREQAGLKGQSNSDASGRFHSDWCSMMYPRLRLARELLTDDGVICISIDDGEQGTLKNICNEVFGERNFITQFIWRKVDAPNDNKVPVTPDHEYILAYAKFIDRATLTQRYAPDIIDAYGITDDQGRKCRDRLLRKNGKNSLRSDRPTMFFPLTAPDGTEVLPIREDGRDGRWAAGLEGIKQAEREGRLIWKKRDGGWVPYTREYAPEHPTKPWMTIWNDLPAMRQTKAELLEVFGQQNVFDTPKPTAMIRRLIELTGASNSIVLDFFSGSAAVADGVMRANATDDLGNSFILVQLPEACPGDSIAKSMGLETICEIGKERIRRAGAKIAAEVEESNKQLRLGEEPKPVPDIGFRVLKLDESGIERPRPGELLLDVVKSDRSDEDIIFEMMLKWGLELTLPIEKVDAAGYPCYSVAYGELVCCLTDGLTMQVLDAIADMEPRRVLMLDRILDDTTKLNAVQAFKRVEEKTGREVELRTV